MFPFEVDSTTDVPLWVQLRQRLIYLINSGYFKPGRPAAHRARPGLGDFHQLQHGEQGVPQPRFPTGYLESRAGAACSYATSTPRWTRSTRRRPTAS